MPSAPPRTSAATSPTRRTSATCSSGSPQLGYGRADILHTAQSLFHDHAPAKRCGLATAWIDRRHDRPGWGATAAPPEGAAWDFRFSALADMVEAHRREAGSDGGAAV